MLFSNDQVADYISKHFEPAWQSVRAVPMVHVDFGNGAVVHRTLHGNIATYVCNEEGRVIDILPGLYSPAAYRLALEKLEQIAAYSAKLVPDNRKIALRAYHSRKVTEILDLLDPDRRPAPLESKTTYEPPLQTAEDKANWQMLAMDTQHNATVRSLEIHEKLGKTITPPRPSQIARWLYKEVLHADLEDPYLGLGEKMFASYPFEPAGQKDNQDFIKTGIGPLAELEGR